MNVEPPPRNEPVARERETSMADEVAKAINQYFADTLEQKYLTINHATPRVESGYRSVRRIG
jgi:hypothetical protein